MGQPRRVSLTDSWYAYRSHRSRAYNLEILGSCSVLLFNNCRGKETRQATPEDPPEGSQRSDRIGDLYELCELEFITHSYPLSLPWRLLLEGNHVETVTDLDLSLFIFGREPLSHLSEVAEEPESSSPDYPTAVSSSSTNTISRSSPTDTSVNYASSAWSPPSSISPNNYAAGLVYGVDIFDAVGEYEKASYNFWSGIMLTEVLFSLDASE
jgi:hypothetical protein